jgi:hypothetical protein
MSSRINRMLNRCWIASGGACLVLFALYLGMVAGARRWPYEVLNTTIITPNAPPGSNFYMARTIDYQDECELNYERLLLSDVPGPKGAFRRVNLEDVYFRTPPWELDRKPWYIQEHIPDDFPCGPARIVDSPSAACNWFQRLFWRQRREDAITRFTVDCSGATPLP